MEEEVTKMAYTPYGAPPEQQQGFGAKDILSAPFEYYKGKYTALPSTWSGSKGIALPFNFNKASYKIAGDAMAQAYKDEGFFAAVKAPFSKWKEMKAAGGRAFGYDQYMDEYSSANAEFNTVRQAFSAASKKQEKYAATFAYRSDLLKRQRIVENAGRNAAWSQQSTKGHFGIGKNSRKARSVERRVAEIQGRLSSKIENQTMKLAGFGSGMRSPINDKPVLAAYEKVQKLARKRFIMGGAKLAVRGMKAMSAIGMLSLAADVAGMVFEPIGAAIVQQANSLAEKYEQRFLPELGGRLNMAYLSNSAATERQRAVNAISKAYINGRSAYGSESALIHS
jgi:hypothetical protein